MGCVRTSRVLRTTSASLDGAGVGLEICLHIKYTVPAACIRRIIDILHTTKNCSHFPEIITGKFNHIEGGKPICPLNCTAI